MQPICERCWIIQEAWVDEAGEHVQIPIPTRLAEPEIEMCAWCGTPTIFGVYKRADPLTVPYPRREA